MSHDGRGNRLASEKSPYLLQHAHNPVDWHPWGEEAFRKARESDKPVFLSIGYATCHWCHVMERESFENEDTAKLLNEMFVPVKVDREERPDVDGVYMAAVQAMTGQGGWPLSVFLAPDGRAFHGGTYFPPEDRWGRPGFPSLLRAVAEAWRSRRAQVLASSEELRKHLADLPLSGEGGELSGETLALGGRQFAARFDRERGGFETAPKFPRAHGLSFLLRLHARGDDGALPMVVRTLEEMSRGGIYDHLGGGFHRYSTDAEWLVPHFEKMLYDQALNALAYLEAHQVTGREDFAGVAAQTLRYVRRDLTDSRGGFHSAEDADSEGVEGRFYVFRRKEILAALGPSDGSFFCDVYGVKEDGNFDDEASGRRTGENVLHLPAPPPAGTAERLESLRARLFVIRATRVRPQKDDKVLADWNGLAVAALSRAGRVLPDAGFTEAAERAAGFVLDGMVAGDRLLHRYRDGEAAIPAFLDDHAFLSFGLLELYEATFDPRWLAESLRLAREALRLFADPAGGGLFLSGADGERLVVPLKEIYDGAIPSGNSVAAFVLARLSRLTGDGGLRSAAEGILRAFSAAIGRQPQAFPFALLALDELGGPGREIVLSGDPRDPEIEAMAREVARRFLPRTSVALRPAGPGAETVAQVIPWIAPLAPAGGRATAYVCENHSCRAPVGTARELAALLDG